MTFFDALAHDIVERATEEWREEPATFVQPYQLREVADLLAFHDVQVKPASWLRAYSIGHGASMLDLDPATGEWACFCTHCLQVRR